jgi:hypothetical protein
VSVGDAGFQASDERPEFVDGLSAVAGLSGDDGKADR